MRMARIVLVSMLALAGCGGAAATSTTTATAANESAPRFSQMTVEEVASGIAASPRLAVFDANSREHFDEQHVPGAVWVDHDAVTREQLPEDPTAPVVFYCYNEQCSASHVAAEDAIALGFTNVSVMGAGISGWVAAGQPVESAQPPTATP